MEALSGLWAKSPRRGTDEGEPLTQHTASVIDRLRNLQCLFPRLPERVNDPRLWHRAFWACVLHDFGKIAAGFQAQLRSKARPWGHRHEVLSLAFLEWVLPDDFCGDRPWIAAGIASHHKDLDDIGTLYPALDDLDDDPVIRLIHDVSDHVVEAIAAWLTKQSLAWVQCSALPGVANAISVPAHPAADFRRHGAARVHRALLAYRRLARHLVEQPAHSSENLNALALRGLILLADHSASADLQQTGSPLRNVKETLSLLHLRAPELLYVHQREAAECRGHAMLVAPTGSGKTEAAILWAARQRDDNCCGRVFYVLPYQASLNAMHARLSRHFPEAVALQHSRALQALYRSLMERGYVPEKAEGIARREQALARLHCHPLRILTPYQLLRAAFRLKGYEALLTDTTDGLFIFDELHAYEPRRLGMILGIVDYLRRQLGGRFLVMSATFPTVLRSALRESIGEIVDLTADEALYKSFIRHRLRLVMGKIIDPAVLARIADHARSGESVLVVCNTVETARNVHRALRQLLADTASAVTLLHGRFNARDRFRKEQRLLVHMGTRTRSAMAAPSVLVATQVVEVSLDVDFDTVFTEPAPLESIVQRFGRVNRGRRHRSCDVHVLTEPPDGQGVYADAYVARALRILEQHADELIDESQVGSWLDRVYDGTAGERWNREVTRWRDEFRAACLADLRAFRSSPDLAEAFDRMFDGTEVLPQVLLEDYKCLSEEDALRASELLVPISAGQLWQLRRAGKVMSVPGEDPIVVSVPYDPAGGLNLTGSARRDQGSKAHE